MEILNNRRESTTGEERSPGIANTTFLAHVHEATDDEYSLTDTLRATLCLRRCDWKCRPGAFAESKFQRRSGACARPMAASAPSKAGTIWVGAGNASTVRAADAFGE